MAKPKGMPWALSRLVVNIPMDGDLPPTVWSTPQVPQTQGRIFLLISKEYFPTEIVLLLLTLSVGISEQWLPSNTFLSS